MRRDGSRRNGSRSSSERTVLYSAAPAYMSAGVAGWTPSSAALFSGAITAVIGALGGLVLLNRGAGPLQLLDRPDHARKRHARPVPLTGGLAILCGLWAGTALAGGIGTHFAVLVLLGLVAAVHLVDDRQGLPPRTRLALDALLALGFVALMGGEIQSLGNIAGVNLALGGLALPVTVIAYVALSNAYNMVDGVDGLAITQFLISISMLALWQTAHVPGSGLAAPALMLIAATAATLLANLGALGRPLKCFLGDSGARLLGFFLVYALVSRGSDLLAPVEALYLVALPVLDLGVVVCERLAAGGSPMRADRRHLHHLLLDAGCRKHPVVLIMGALALALASLPFLLAWLGAGQGQAWVLLAQIAIAYLSWRRPLARALGARQRRRSAAVGMVDLR